MARVVGRDGFACCIDAAEMRGDARLADRRADGPRPIAPWRCRARLELRHPTAALSAHAGC